MAVTTSNVIDYSKVVFSSSGAAADLTDGSLTEDTLGILTFDVLAASGGGTKTTIWSVDDGDVELAAPTGTTLTNNFLDYNTDLLYKDGVGVVNAEFTEAGGKFWIENGKIKYDASGIAGLQSLGAGESFTDTFEYTIRMSNGTLSVGTLTVVINGVNDAPTDINLSASTVDENADGAVIGTLSTVDVDANDTHTYTVDDVRFEVVNGQLKLKAGETLNFETEQTVTVNVTTDDGLATFTEAFVITVNDVNEDPDAGTDQTVNVSENINAAAIIATVTATDPDAGGGNDGTSNFEDLTYSITAGNDDGLFEIDANGNISLAPGKNLDFETDVQHTLTVTVTDGGGLTDTVDVTINVDDVDEAPPPPVDVAPPAPPVFTGTGDPNDFDGLGNPSGQNTSSSATNGDDTLYGGAGNDTINGGGGDDIIYGGSGNDALGGGNDDDSLYGGSNNDTIIGGNEADNIIGGYGADTLTGGNGNDKFIYLSTNDTGDTINDFKANGNADKIDFSALFGGTLNFIAGDSNATVVANSVTWTEFGGNTIVSVDVTGDTTADLQITLTGIGLNLTSGDFIL